MKLYSKRYTSIGGMVIFKRQLKNKPTHYWKTRGHVAVLSSSFSTCFILQNCSFLRITKWVTKGDKVEKSQYHHQLWIQQHQNDVEANLPHRPRIFWWITSRTSDDLTVAQSPVSSWNVIFRCALSLSNPLTVSLNSVELNCVCLFSHRSTTL